MPDASSGVRPKRHSSAEQDSKLTVRPLFAVEPLFTEGQQREHGKENNSGVGLLLHLPVDDVVKVGNIMSAIDDMLHDMALEGYLLPVAQSEDVKTLKEIRRSGKFGTLP